MIKESKEFIDLQKRLLQHKKDYYVNNNSKLSDREYDLLERESFKMARDLGFRADPWEDAEENEKHHVHWIVGYNKESIYNS